VRFADDKLVVASSEKMLQEQEVMDNINVVTKDYEMKINVKRPR